MWLSLMRAWLWFYSWLRQFFGAADHDGGFAYCLIGALGRGLFVWGATTAAAKARLIPPVWASGPAWGFRTFAGQFLQTLRFFSQT